MTQHFETTVKGKVFPHRELWHTATRQYETARRTKKGASHFDIAAILLGYLAYEAYLNLLISELDDEVFRNERNFFSRSNGYPGTRGKLDWVLEKLDGIEIDKDARPFTTIVKIRHLRDKMAHGKSYDYSEKATHTENNDPLEWPKGAFDEVTAELASAAIADLEEFMEHIHTFAAPLISDPWLKAGALKGTSAYQTGTIRVAT